MEPNAPRDKGGFRPDLEYCTEAELRLFRYMRRTGELTFFRTSVCVVCGTEVPKNKRYCSLACKRRTEPETDKQEEGDDYDW